MISTKSPSFRRLITQADGGHDFYGIKTDAGTISKFNIAHSVGEPGFGCFAISSGQFYVATSVATVEVYSSDFNHVTSINLDAQFANSIMSVIYDQSLDQVFVFGLGSTTNIASIINPASNTVGGVIVVAGVHGEYMLNAGQAQCMVTQFPNQEFKFYSLPSFTLQSTLPIPVYGYSNAYCPDNNRVYVCSGNAGTVKGEVWEVNPATQLVEFVYSLDTHLYFGSPNSIFDMAYEPSQKKLFVYYWDVATFDDTIAKIDPVGRQINCLVDSTDAGFESSNDFMNLGIDYSSHNLFLIISVGVKKYTYPT